MKYLVLSFLMIMSLNILAQDKVTGADAGKSSAKDCLTNDGKRGAPIDKTGAGNTVDPKVKTKQGKEN